MTELEKKEAVNWTKIKKPLFVLSLIFSSGPLVIGISIFLLWWLTQSKIFEHLGYLTICVGLISVCLALMFVIGYAAAALMAKESGKKIILCVIAVVAIIIINFPAALACIAGYDYISSLFVLTVENKSSVIIRQVTVSGSCTTTNSGQISPGGIKNIKFYDQGEGPLYFSVSSNDLKINGDLDVGYASRPPGGKKTLVIKDGGKYIVEGHD